MSSKTLRKMLSKEEITKYQNDLQNELNMAHTFLEYFLIIGLDPRISMRNYLYNTEPSEILKYYANEIKPEVLSKYPPMKKSIINIDNSIIDICFQNDFNLEEFSSQPEPEIFSLLLDNYFYSIDYPHKYITCLKFYESLECYHKLKTKLQNKLGNNYDGKIPKYDGFGSNSINFFDNSELDLSADLSFDGNKSYEVDYMSRQMNDKLKNYYFPKIICLIGLQPFYKEQEIILRQIYNYYINNGKKKIPLEKIILNILCNIPIPPNGLFELSYKFKNEGYENKNFNEIKIKEHKYNELKSIDYNVNIILSIFNIDNLLEIFKYTLYEIKTLIFSTNINNLCIFVNGILSLIYPFNYSFQVSSCVPKNALDVLESISPYIFGINQIYTESFFKDNNISIDGVDLMIIDIDNKKVIIKTDNKKDYPDLPPSYFKKLKSGIEGCSKKLKSLNKGDNNKEYNLFSYIFYDLFLYILENYSNYLNNDYFVNKSKYKNSNIKGLFKINDFVNSHYSNERPFIQKLVNSQMFCDFIFKKMLPKNLSDKMDILFFDESLNKKYNDKILLFGKKKPLFFLNSKEYEYKHIFNIPKVKDLSLEEKNRYNNNNYILKNLFLGQDIDIEYNINTEENDYFFNYILFPVLNNDYFFYPNYDYFFSSMSDDIRRINIDILSKSYLNSMEGNEIEMLNYIYLTYIEIWGYSYFYQKLEERNYRFEELLLVLDKVYHHEIELFNILFESLSKFNETDKILRLYERFLSYKLTPSNYIYSIVGKIIDKQKKSRPETIDQKYNDIEMSLRTFSSNSLKIQCKDYKNKLERRVFRTEDEKNIFGEFITFQTNQLCPECGKLIDIENISLDYKNMKKDSLWAQCKLCNQYILPQLTVKLGSDINSGHIEETSKTTKFILHSPYELKLNLKETIDKDGSQYLEVEKFKMKYPSLFWSCIWYFKLYKLDIDIMLPYESSFYQLNLSDNYYKCFIENIISKTDHENKIELCNIIENKIHFKSKKNKGKAKKYDLIIQDVFSFYYINNKFNKYCFDNIKFEDKRELSHRKKTLLFNKSEIKYRTISGFLLSTEYEDPIKKDDNDLLKSGRLENKIKNIFLDDCEFIGKNNIYK